MESSRRKKIRELADKITQSYGLTVPVDLEALVAKLGGEIGQLSRDEATTAEAKIVKRDKGFQILLDPNKPQHRKRFSIAHELGHLFVHMGYLIDPNKWNNAKDFTDVIMYREYAEGLHDREYEAHEFAASLLMPEKEFREQVEKHTTGSSCNIPPIAAYFKVSHDAAVRRGQWLDLLTWD